MTTFDDLDIGEIFETPSRSIAPADVDALVRIGGYTHPLFTDPDHAKNSVFGKRPVPGQALLLIMGGLVEQSGRFDGTVVALLGFEQVRFEKPAFEDDEVLVRIEVVEKAPKPSGGGVLTMEWHCVRGADVLARARAAMLFRGSD